MGILNYNKGFPTNKGFQTMSISVVENLASTALVFYFLALGVFGVVELGGLFGVGGMRLS